MSIDNFLDSIDEDDDNLRSSSYLSLFVQEQIMVFAYGIALVKDFVDS